MDEEEDVFGLTREEVMQEEFRSELDELKNNSRWLQNSGRVLALFAGSFVLAFIIKSDGECVFLLINSK